MKLRTALYSILAISALASTAHAEEASIYDMDHVFECTTLGKGGSRISPKYDTVLGIYTDSKTSSVKRCEFKGADGELWHPLFPSHTPDNDDACKIAYQQQGLGNTLSKFPVPPSCLTYNEAANLMTANVPASANPELGQSISFATRIEMIRNAKKSIRIQYLIFFGDESGWAIADELKKKKAENPNIKIQVNVDALSNIANETNQKFRTQAMFFDLQQHGIEVNGAGIGWIYLNEYYAGNPLELDHRWHDKIFVVDAEDPDTGYAIIGGQNIGNEYFRVGTYINDGTHKDGEPVFDHKIWRDQDVLLRGPIIRDVAKAFNNNFEHFQKLAQNNKDAMDPSKQEGDTFFQNLKVKFVAKVKQEFNSLNMKLLKEVPGMGKLVDWDSLLAAIPSMDPAHRPTQYTSWTHSKKDLKNWDLVTQVEQNCPKFFMGTSCMAKWEKVKGSHDRLTIEFYPYDNRYVGDAGINKENGLPFINEAIHAHVNRIYAQLNQGSLIQKLHDQGRFHKAEMRWFNNHPRFGETYIMQAYTDAVKRAKSEIIISNAYFIPHGDKEIGLDVAFMTELQKAVTDRGVHVVLMTNDVPDNDDAMITWNARWYWPTVLAWNKAAKVGPNGKKGLVEIYEWNGAGNTDLGGVWRGSDRNQQFPENTNHAKYGVFDGQEAIVGSFNLDHRSTGINSETVLALRSVPFAQEMVEQFKRNDMPKAIKVTNAQAAKWVNEINTSSDPKVRACHVPAIEKEN